MVSHGLAWSPYPELCLFLKLKVASKKVGAVTTGRFFEACFEASPVGKFGVIGKHPVTSNRKLLVRLNLFDSTVGQAEFEICAGQVNTRTPGWLSNR